MSKPARTLEGYPIVNRVDGVPRYTIGDNKVDTESTVDPRNPYVDISGDTPVLVGSTRRIAHLNKALLPSVVVLLDNDSELTVTLYDTKQGKKTPAASLEARVSQVATILNEKEGVIDDIAAQNLGHLGVFGVQERAPYVPAEALPATQSVAPRALAIASPTV